MQGARVIIPRVVRCAVGGGRERDGGRDGDEAVGEGRSSNAAYRLSQLVRAAAGWEREMCSCWWGGGDCW